MNQLFDKTNMTQDIEIVWRLVSKGYKARMCLATGVYSETPSKLRQWWRQRIRWTIGGNQTLFRYKKYFLRKGMLGLFIIPLFAFSLFLGLFGLMLFGYLIMRRLIVSYLLTEYSLYADIALLHLQEFSFIPSILNYFGAVLFLLGGIFTLFGIWVMRGLKQGKFTFFTVIFYILVYLTLLPLVMIVALYKLARGKYTW